MSFPHPLLPLSKTASKCNSKQYAYSLHRSKFCFDALFGVWKLRFSFQLLRFSFGVDNRVIYLNSDHFLFKTLIPTHRCPVCQPDVSWSMSSSSVSFLTRVLDIVSRYAKNWTETDLLVFSQMSGLRSLTNSPQIRNSQRPLIIQWLERRNSNSKSVAIRFLTPHPWGEKGKFSVVIPRPSFSPADWPKLRL